MGDTGSTSAGTIHLTVTGISKLKKALFVSSQISIRNLNWRIMVSPIGDLETTSLGFVLKCFGAENTSKWQCSAVATFTLRAQKSNCEDIVRRLCHTFSPQENLLGYSNFINWIELVDPANGFLENDLIKLEIRVYADPPIGLDIGNEFQKMQKRIFHDARFTDFTVLTDAGTVFSVHKCILAARSEYFEAMLNTNMFESNSNQTLVPGFSDPVTLGMLEYIYTGETEILVEFGEEWLRIGDMYKLDGLKAEAGQAISTKVNVQNAAAFFYAAWLYNVPFLQQKVSEFIKKNRAAVLSTEGFKKICKNPDRIAELIEAISI